MWLKKFLLLALSIFAIQQISMVNEIKAQEKVVTINSDPPGAMLYFRGENSFVGVTPFKVKPKLTGRYKITAVKSGYEKYMVEYIFKGTEKGTLRLKLVEKTRIMAGMRSLAFPGWGQMYSERNKSGLFLSILQVGAGLFTLVSHLNYENAFDEYQNAKNDYTLNEKKYDLRIKYRDILEQKYDKATNAFDKRQTWLFISGGIWLYNILDAIILFPSYDKGISDRSIPRITANFQNDGLGLKLSVPF